MDMTIVPGVLGCCPLRRTVQLRLGINPAVLRDGCRVARPSYLHGLATVIHEISGLAISEFLLDSLSLLWTQFVPLFQFSPDNLAFFGRNLLPLPVAFAKKLAFLWGKSLPFLHPATQLLSFLRGKRFPLPVIISQVIPLTR